MSKFEISLSKDDLEHIANGYDIKIKINGKRFLKTNEIILKPAVYLKGLSEGYAWTGYEEIIGNVYENKELLEVKE